MTKPTDDRYSNSNSVSNEVLYEKLKNLESKLDERAVAQKQALDAALVAAKSAVDSALLEKEKSVNAAFAASEKAISKAEDSQRDYNKTIVELQKDIVSLKESRSQSGGKDQAHNIDKQDNTTGRSAIWSYIIGAIGMITAVLTIVIMMTMKH